MTACSSEYFYDPMRVFYDGGVDYLTVEKHRLVVIASHAYTVLVKISCGDYGDFPISIEQINQDMDDLSKLCEFFKNAKEFRLDANSFNYKYELDYIEQIKNLDNVLLKYIELLDFK